MYICMFLDHIHFHNAAFIDIHLHLFLFNSHAVKIIQDTCIASVLPNLVVAHLATKLAKIPTVRSGYYAPPAPGLTAAQYRREGAANIVCGNLHRHCSTCEKIPNQCIQKSCKCRLAYGRALDTDTCVREIKSTATTEGKHFPDVSLAVELPQSHSWTCAHSLGEKLNSLGSAAGNKRVLDFPLVRPYLRFDDELFEKDPAGSKEVLRRQLIRQNVTRVNLGLAPIDSDKIADEHLEDSLSMSMQSIGYGALEKHTPKLLLAEHKEYILNLTDSVQRVAFVDYASQANALIGESNEVVAAAIGCNFNAQAIVSTESAMNAIFYLCEYMLKDGMEVAAMLGIVAAAVDRCKTFEGKAPEGEDAKAGSRPQRRLLSVILNGCVGATEICLQQCVLNIVNFPAHFSSDLYHSVFPGPAIKMFRANSNSTESKAVLANTVSAKLAPRAQYLSEKKHKQASVRGRSKDTTDAEIAAGESKYAKQNVDAQHESRDHVFLGRAHRNSANDLVLSSQDIEYNHRGNALSRLCIVEYSSLIQRKSLTESNGSTSSRGRHSSGVFEFAEGYPLREQFFQHISSIVRIPNFSGSLESTPTYNPANSDNHNDAANNRFFEYVLALYLPWPAPGHSYENVGEPLAVRFETFLTQLREETLFLQMDGSYGAPPGFNETPLPANSIGM